MLLLAGFVVALLVLVDQANAGLEQALSRLQELGGEQQQLEARLGLITDENKELAQQVSASCFCLCCNTWS